MNAMSSIEETNEFDDEDLTPFQELRKTLREKILASKILGEIEETTFMGTFDGSGDSGQFHNDCGNDEINQFLAKAIDEFVNFNWYDGEGGGGDITWDIVADKIIINGYTNETVQHTEMAEEEF